MADYASLHLTVVQGQEAKDKINMLTQTVTGAEDSMFYDAPVFILVSASEQQKAPNILSSIVLEESAAWFALGMHFNHAQDNQQCAPDA